MERSDTASILKRIRTNYPDFFIDDEVLEEWHKELVHYSYLDIEEQLNEYLRTDNNKPPRLNHLVKGIKTLEQKYDEAHDYIVNCNLCKRQMTFKNYNDHYGRCLQVETLWKKSIQLGKEIPRDEISQFGQDILDKLEEKYIKDMKLELKKI